MTLQQSLPALTDHLGFWLRLVSNEVSYGFANRLESKGVTMAEWVILRIMFDREPMPPSQIAKELGMTRGAITKLADRLIHKSLMIRKADSADGRGQTLALTAKAKNLVPDLAVLADENESEFFGQLSKVERSHLTRILKQLAAHRQVTTIPVK